MIKKTFLLFTILSVFLFESQSQSPERPKREIPLLSEVVSTLDNATGWILQNNGEWVSERNKIPFKEYNLNLIKRGRYQLGRENFTVIEVRSVTIKDVVYSIIIIKYEDGKYDFPLLEERWQGFKNLKYYAFKESKWNNIFPDSIISNKPFAVNMQLLTSGTIPDYDEKPYLYEIENAIQKAVYLQEESVNNLIFAMYPIEIEGTKSVRFKLYETINKLEIYMKFLMDHNWLKLFRNSYYEVDYADFANFVLNIGVIDPSKLKNPDYYRFFFERGIIKYNETKFVTSLQLFTKAAMVNPPDSSLISISLWKGKSRIQLRLFEEAIEDFNQALERVPMTTIEKQDWIEAHYQRGNAYYEILDFSKACEDWNTSLALGYDDALKSIKKYCGKSMENGSLSVNIKKAGRYFDKAMKKYEEKEYLEAQFLFEKSLQNNPMNNNFKIPYYIGMCRFNIGDYVRSVDDYDKAYKFRPEIDDPEFDNWVNVLVWRGKALQQCGYLDQACEDWTEANALNSVDAADFLANYCVDYRPKKKKSASNSMTLIEQGISSYNLGDFAGTINILDEAIEIDTTAQNLLLFTYRAAAKHKLKDYTGALADFTKAISLKPVNEEELKSWREAFYNRGVSKYFLNDFEGACKDWDAALNQGVKDALLFLNSYCKGKISFGEKKIQGLLQNNQQPDNSGIDKKTTENNIEPAGIDDKKKLSTFLSEIDAISKTFNNSTSSAEIPVVEANSNQKPSLIQAKNSYYIIIGAFKVLENAERLSKEVKSKGYNPEIIRKADKSIWVLSIASFNNQEAALSKLKEVKLEYPAAYLFSN
jgi:tetratricopeptide (TPR) repeat protein